MKTVYLFREDLRINDNPALSYAAAQGQVLPVYVMPKGLGGASKWWLHHSLKSLQSDLSKLGAELLILQGDTVQQITEIVKAISADQVVWNRIYSPQGIETGKLLVDALDKMQVQHRSFNSQLLIEPTKIFNKQGTPFKVFTPFWRHCVGLIGPFTLSKISEVQAVKHQLKSDTLNSLELLPTIPWDKGIAETWNVGEAAAQQSWSGFLQNKVSSYKEGRDFPGQAVTSLLSPHLAFGEISPQRLWNDMQQEIAAGTVDAENANKFLAELGWREFSRYLLVHFPEIVSEPFNKKFENFPWRNSEADLKAWQRGKTGYPLVDAGMRELWVTGYMHNRVRMVVASFLCKHLLIHWQHGADWFWDTLVDADIANNTVSWQWVAGCGADAAPYFRIFNPITQGEKFDKLGSYVRKWVPEVTLLPDRYIFKPWAAPPEFLYQAYLKLGKDYPEEPIIDHKEARERALEAYQVSKTVH